MPSRALPPKVYKALVEGAATGSWPDGSIPGTEDLQTFFAKNGPRWQVAQGRRLDIPMLFRQGTTDTLFNLQQGLDNWRTVLTRRARKHSIFIGYNGGHVLPGGLPSRQSTSTSDPCSQELAGDAFAALSRRFMDEQLKRVKTGLPATASSTSRRRTGPVRRSAGSRPTPTCRSARSPPPRPEASRSPTRSPTGPIRIAGSAYLTGNLTALGLTTGRSTVSGSAPRRSTPPWCRTTCCRSTEPTPVTGQPRRIELPAVAVDVPAGKTLYVIASPISVTFAGTGSRTPGAIVLADTVAHLPVVGRCS